MTVLPPAPCEATVAFKELKDDAIKFDLGNAATQRRATMDTFTLVFPADYGLIKEIKLDGNVFKADDSASCPDGLPSGTTLGPAGWTKADVTKRQLDPGETRTLEVKFTAKGKGFTSADFSLNVTFEEGCSVSF